MNQEKEAVSDVNIEYPALSKACDTLNIQWYRSAMEPERFRELSKRNDLRGWIQAGGHFGLFMMTGLFVYLAWAAEFWVIFLIVLFIHGTVVNGHGWLTLASVLESAFRFRIPIEISFYNAMFPADEAVFSPHIVFSALFVRETRPRHAGEA